MKKCFLILAVSLLIPNVYAGITDSLSIGFGGGYIEMKEVMNRLHYTQELVCFFKLDIN